MPRFLLAALAGLLLAACAHTAAGDMTDTDMTDRRFIEAAGIPVHVKAWAAPASPRAEIFMIHGASEDLGTFEPTVAPLLQAQYALSAYDRPGLGYTAKRPPRADRLGEQAEVAAQAIRTLGLNRPIVLAHSYGGAVALRLALDHPDLVSGLVLIAPVAYPWPGGVAWHYHLSGAPVVGPVFNVLIQPFAGGAARSGVSNAFGDVVPPASYFTTAGVDRATSPRALGANAKDVLALEREVIAQSPRYAEIKVPVGLMSGDKDTVVSLQIHSEALTRVLPTSRLIVIPGAGHLPHEVAPSELEALVDWVAMSRKP
jgi:pimeloyl-ACP methyl ester carboxylesterase